MDWEMFLIGAVVRAQCWEQEPEVAGEEVVEAVAERSSLCPAEIKSPT